MVTMNSKSFRVFFKDDRFPDLEVSNEGTIKFFVMRDNKPVDSFLAFDFADRREVSIEFAKARAEKFFNYLDGHPWLLNAYKSKHI